MTVILPVAATVHLLEEHVEEDCTVAVMYYLPCHLIQLPRKND